MIRYHLWAVPLPYPQDYYDEGDEDGHGWIIDYSKARGIGEMLEYRSYFESWSILQGQLI